MALEKDDNIWRNIINTVKEFPDTGKDAPEIESIPKKRVPKKFFVQKIVTEIMVWTDIEGHAFNEVVFQDLTIIGNITDVKLKRLLSAEHRKRNIEG